MKNLLKNYLDNLTIDKLLNFGIKNNINLNNEEADYLIKLAQNNFDDILANENKYLDLVKEKVSNDNFIKIRELFLYYKNRYKGYLF